MSPPLKLTDDEMSQIYRCAEPIPRANRDQFLQTVASKLAGVTIGPGTVFRICAETQRELLNGSYPEFGSGSWSKYT